MRSSIALSRKSRFQGTCACGPPQCFLSHADMRFVALINWDDDHYRCPVRTNRPNHATHRRVGAVNGIAQSRPGALAVGGESWAQRPIVAPSR